MKKYLDKLHNPDLGILLIRIALGVVFIYAGWLKLQMVDVVVTGFAAIGIPAFLAYVVMYTELIGGILLVLGLYVRVASILLAIIMTVATIKVHWAAGFSLANGGYEYTFVLGLAAIALVTLGSGKYALVRLMRRK